jgi:hypothetical protein
MSVFSYHLVKISLFSSLKLLFFSRDMKNINGLIHSERMSSMTLGSPIFSPSRMLIRKVAFFAQWENEKALDNFFTNHNFGRQLAKGWHVRLEFVRKWGKISEFKIPDENLENIPLEGPVVAVTLARMKLFEIPRFIAWGRPVEKLVRDHPGTILSLASIRLPRTVSTFSIWKNLKDMTDMVHGHSAVPKPKRHIDAMKERDRKDFHIEFTTLRFRAISESGEWNGKKNYISNL